MFGSTRKGQQRNVFTNNKFNQNGQNFVKKNQFPSTKSVGTNTTAPNRDAVIARNLQHMKLVAQKKRQAQEFYYSGRSPLVKTGAPFKRNARVSVQQRLGDKSQNTNPNKFRNNRVNFNNKPNYNSRPNFTSTPNVAQNRQNFVRKNNQSTIGELRSDKIARTQNLQQKRARFQNPNNSIKNVDKFRNVAYKRKLRAPDFSDYSVSITNDKRLPLKHHVSNGLNPQLQQEIKLIQNKSSRQLVLPTIPEIDTIPVMNPVINEERLPIVATTKTLNERFSMI